MTSTVFDNLVGQHRVVETLHRAVDDAKTQLRGETARAMTHAWLFTGPPGSGRSNAARAFAAALQCETGGCGQCLACRTVLAGSHPDATMLATEHMTISVDDMRGLVRTAYTTPGNGRWQVIVLEDADRLGERAADALLKSLEEPAPRTVWLLCAPSVEDVPVTIASRCRVLTLTTPHADDIAAMLARTEPGVGESVAAYAAQAAQGHVGRARKLATDEAARRRRREVLQVPLGLRDIGSCMRAAANVHEAAEEIATERCNALDARDIADLEAAYGVEGPRNRARGYAGALSALKEDHKRRRRRIVTDSIDGVLIELLAFYRDALVMGLGAVAPLINPDQEPQVRELAERSTPEETLGRMEAILACREALPANAAPLLALEAMMIRLRV